MELLGLPVLVNSGRHNKTLQTGWPFSHTLEARRPRSRCQQGWFLLRPLSLAHWRPRLSVSSHGLRSVRTHPWCLCVSKFPLLIQTTVIRNQGPPKQPPFNLLTSWKAVSKYNHSLKHWGLELQYTNLVEQETWVRSLGREDPLEKSMATHSSILAWRIPWTEEPGGLQSRGLHRVRHDWATNTHSQVSVVPEGRRSPLSSMSAPSPPLHPWDGPSPGVCGWASETAVDFQGRKTHFLLVPLVQITFWLWLKGLEYNLTQRPTTSPSGDFLDG